MSVSWKGGGQSDIIMLGMGKTILNLNVFVILRPSLGFEILQCSGLILPHRMEFYADKTTLLGSEFLHPVTINFFYPRKFCCTVQCISNILFYQLHLLHDTQRKKQSLISKHSLLGKDSTTPTSQLQWSQSLRTTKKLHSTLHDG